MTVVLLFQVWQAPYHRASDRVEEASVGRGGVQRCPGAAGVHPGGTPRHLRLLPRVPRV